eukprot:TRINITY_DN1954_c0_g1_i1.p1 TRINITY_DN1954_c0_g1~~TRINITY_DN1954_c0_g1_i1.p1  ORF type:complete len:118 (-),score=43.76 TRINITY_DN1954_c0_g1_i1:103-456(-)
MSEKGSKKRVKEDSSEDEGSADKAKFFDLGKNKRVSINQFKGVHYVDIREFYTDKSGETKPGKKGIALNEEQWNELKRQMADIDALLPSSGSSKEKPTKKEKKGKKEKPEKEEEDDE